MVNVVDSTEIELLKRLAIILHSNENRDPNQGVIFYGVNGKCQQCADSPSWLNQMEANCVSRS